MLRVRVQVRAGGDADGAGHGGAEVGEDVAEQVRAHDHVEALGEADEVRGEDVDVVLGGLDVGVALGHGGEALVPERHGVDDAVRLGGGGEVPALAGLRQVEGVAQHPVDAVAGEDALLDRHLAVGAGVEAAADLRVLALDVLAHDHEVDVAGLLAGERALHPVEQAHGPQVHVLVEVAADGDEQAPERDVVGHGGPADRAQEDRLEGPQPLDAVLGHHATKALEALAAPGELLELEADPEAAADGLERAQALGHHLLADPVARDHRDLVTAHGAPALPRLPVLSRAYSPGSSRQRGGKRDRGRPFLPRQG
jgi:hypothetical protein